MILKMKINCYTTAMKKLLFITGYFIALSWMILEISNKVSGLK